MTVNPLVAGNWKMNGLRASIAEFEALKAGLSPMLLAKIDVGICPPPGSRPGSPGRC
jgi:triosephosphate isomerase (TIM)